MKPFFLFIALCVSLLAQAQVPDYDWAQFSRYEAANQQVMSRPKAVLMGNSITDFWPGTHPEFFQQNNFVGRGISGQTTSQMLVRFSQDVLALRPEMVVILAGTNDIAHNNGVISMPHMLGNIDAMCRMAEAEGIKPLICTLLPCKQFWWRTELNPADSIRAFNKMLRAYAMEHHYPLVNYYDALADAEGGLPAAYADDGVHPNANGYAVMEKVLLEAMQPAVVRHIEKPYLDIYLPQGVERPNVILSIPGGAYAFVSMQNEGTAVADYFTRRGLAVAVLKYQLPAGRENVSLNEACAAMEMLRDSADVWGLGNKIGAIGFSAGGHLCSSLLTKYHSEKARPDFGILIYPVISMENGITHEGTRENLLGKNAHNKKKRLEWSTDRCVTPNTPPCLIAACQDDDCVPVENSLLFYQALTRNHVEAEMLLLPVGSHGWGFDAYLYGRTRFNDVLDAFTERHFAK